MQYEGRHLKKFAATDRLEALEAPSALYETFHQNCKLAPLGARAYGQQINRSNASPLIKVLTAKPYKVYSLGPQLPLAPCAPDGELERVILERRSRRTYSGEPITLEELARLLSFSYGITDRSSGFRAVPSGGALYPLELYVLPIRVTGLETAVYHYDVEEHRLDYVDRVDLDLALNDVINFRDVAVEDAAVVLVITAVFVRSTIKYLDRGYRLIMMEAGEVAQNLSLLATAMGLSSCLVGGFLDDDLSALLGIDGLQEAPLAPVVIGRPGATAKGARRPPSGNGHERSG